MRMLANWALVLVLGCTGCSSFNREWKKAALQPAPAGLAGRWEGHWLSDVNGHNGRLRCLMTKVDDTTYQARFHAIYWKILRFSYTVPLNVQCATNHCAFNGQVDLGKLGGGIYQYSGSTSLTNFQSTYSSKYDHGTFRMARPQPKS